MRNNSPVADGLSGHFLTSCNPDDQPDLWGLIRSLAISHLQAIKLSGLIRYSPFPIETSRFFLHIHDTSNINNSWNVVMTKIFAIFMTHFRLGLKKTVLAHIVNNYQFNWVLTCFFSHKKNTSHRWGHRGWNHITGTGLWNPGGGSGWASPPETLHLGCYVQSWKRQGIKPKHLNVDTTMS